VGDVHAGDVVLTVATDPETPDPAASPWYTVHELASSAVLEALAAAPVPVPIAQINATAATNPINLANDETPPQ
jgi:hypothetical protein